MNKTEKIPRGRIFLILFICCFAAYNNALYNDFIYDDRDQILGNEWIRNVRHIPEIFSKGAWSFSEEHVISNYYRPMMHVINAATYHIFGPQAWAFHLVNIILHSGVCFLIFLLGSKIFDRPHTRGTAAYLSPPFIAALLFAVHPIHTEAVTWIASLPDLSVTFFGLIGILFYIRSRDAAHARRSDYILSVFFFFLAALCKETALVLPAVILTYDIALGKNPAKLKLYLPYIALSGLYFLLRSHALGGIMSNGSYEYLSGYQKLLNILPLFAGYLQKLLLPVNLRFWYTFHPIMSFISIEGIISFGIVLSFGAALYASYRKDKVIFFSLSLILISLLPAFYISAIPGKPFAERYLYLPSVGFAFISALLMFRTNAGKKGIPSGLAGILTALLAFYLLGTISRNNVWKNECSFWSDTALKAPDSDLSRYNLGLALLEKGESDQAIKQAIQEFQTAVSLNPKEDRAYHNLGMAYLALNSPDLAIGHFQTALKLRPNRAETYFGLGFAYMKKGLTDKAVEQYRKGLKLKPNDVQARRNIGHAFLAKGMTKEAIEQYQTALKIEPKNADIYNDLRKIYSKSGASDKTF